MKLYVGGLDRGMNPLAVYIVATCSIILQLWSSQSVIPQQMVTYTLGTNDFPELHTLVSSCINFIFVTNSPGPSKHSPQQGPSEKGSRAVSPASSQKS